MRKIKITKELLATVEDFNMNLFVNTRHVNFVLPVDKLTKLKSKIKSKNAAHRSYVQKIIDCYPEILNATPEKMKELIEEFNVILGIHDVNLNLGTKKRKFLFHEAVVSAMRYTDLRQEEYPEYLRNSGIRTCVYCNSQSALVIDQKFYSKKRKKVKKVSAKLQVDHYHPKSLYPFLSTSFFNLYPTCANCNLAKGTKKALFELYTTSDVQDIFRFWIDNESILDYWIKLNLEDLNINLESIDGNIAGLQNHNELFQVQAIYDSQKDVAEELVIKAKANPEVYRQILHKSFGKIFSDPSIIDRILIGNYSKPDEVFKRPMAKYSQDIARQLKIIS